MEKIYLIKGREWIADLYDDAAASSAVALGALPISEITFEVDLAMSALTVSALGGSAGAVLVLSHILCLAPLDHPFAKELSTSWLMLNLRRALSAKATAAVTCSKVGEQHSAAARALHTGDAS
jgi:hypothetical protein